MTDRQLIYPLVKRSDGIHTMFHITPNQITLGNNLVISPLIFYYLCGDFFWTSLFLIYIRAYLDSLDGYIARTYKLCSPEGDIYDHFGDCLFAGTMISVLTSKFALLEPYSASMGFFTSVCSVVIDYDTRFEWISKQMGVGGNEDGYSLSASIIPVIVTNIITYVIGNWSQ
jgi:hypothetical protein